MPTFSLSPETCEALRQALVPALRQPGDTLVIWTPVENLRPALQELHDALCNALTVGTFDPALALQVLERVEKAPVRFARLSDGPELFMHAEQLAAMQLFESAHRNRDGTEFSAYQLGSEGQALLSALRRWKACGGRGGLDARVL